MATVIDALVVSLGLDPKGFKKGADEADKRIKDTEGVVRRSSDAMVSGFRRVATEFIGLFVAVRSVSDVVGFLEHVNQSTRQLGLDSKNLGIAANELRDWQNAAVLAGGTAEGVTNTIDSLQKSIFQMQTGGGVSSQLLWFMRLGVQVTDATGKLRDFGAIQMQLASIMERNGRSRAENKQVLQAMGWDPGTTNNILDGTKALAAYIEKQKQLRQTTPQDIEAATKLAQAWEYMKERIVTVAQSLITSAEPAIMGLIGLLDQAVRWVSAHQDDIVQFFERTVAWIRGPGGPEIKSFFSDLATVIGALARAVLFLTDAWGAMPSLELAEKVSVFSGPLNFAEMMWKRASAMIRGNQNNNPGNLKAVGDQPRDEKGFRTFATREEGEAAANAQLDRYDKRGINTISSIVNTWAPASDNNNVPAYIDALKRATGKGENDPLTQADRPKLLQGIFSHETGSSDVRQTTKVLSGRPAALSFAPNPAALEHARDATPTPALQTSGPPLSSNVDRSSSVTIESMQVNTQATDADRMAADAWRAVQRKFTLAQAEPGLA